MSRAVVTVPGSRRLRVAPPRSRSREHCSAASCGALLHGVFETTLFLNFYLLWSIWVVSVSPSLSLSPSFASSGYHAGASRKAPSALGWKAGFISRGPRQRAGALPCGRGAGEGGQAAVCSGCRSSPPGLPRHVPPTGRLTALEPILLGCVPRGLRGLPAPRGSWGLPAPSALRPVAVGLCVCLAPRPRLTRSPVIGLGTRPVHCGFMLANYTGRDCLYESGHVLRVQGPRRRFPRAPSSFLF